MKAGEFGAIPTEYFLSLLRKYFRFEVTLK